MDNEVVEYVYSFKLYETTGESEVKSNPVKPEQEGIDCDDQDPVFYVAALVNDEAESCSRDSSYSFVRDAKRRKVCEARDNHSVDGKIEEQSVDAYRETWYRKDDDMEKRRKSTVSVESTDEELIKEKEENRLFWEACLAA